MRHYEVRAEDGHGDMGVLAGRYWLRWRAERHLRRAERQRHEIRQRYGWTEVWHYYIREVS